MTTETGKSRRTAPAKCATCEQTMDNPLFCGSCRKLHPADNVSHFELLGLAAGYDLDLDLVRRKYLGLARAIHPDRFPDAADELTRLSERVSAQVNEAFQTLSDPVLRAEYLLELSGGKSATEDKSVPRQVLTESLMLREEIEQARAAHDRAALARLGEQIGQLRERTLGGIAELARKLPGDPDRRRALREKLNTIKYYQRMLEAL